MKTIAMSTRIVLLVLAALLALPSVQIASPVEAKKRPRTITRTFANTASIGLPSSASSPASATLYPSPIVVAGLKGKIRDVNLTLNNFSNPYPDDVEVLLVGPRGQTAVVMADVGGGMPASGATLRLDDEAAKPLPDGPTLQSGAFRPKNFKGDPVVFNAPAPRAGRNTTLSVFDGTDPNGVWRLYVQDLYGPLYDGDIAGGWMLEIETKVK